MYVQYISKNIFYQLTFASQDFEMLLLIPLSFLDLISFCEIGTGIFTILEFFFLSFSIVLMN